jgi:hypothetical protein
VTVEGLAPKPGSGGGFSRPIRDAAYPSGNIINEAPVATHDAPLNRNFLLLIVLLGDIILPFPALFFGDELSRF